MLSDIAALVSVRPLSHDKYESCQNPAGMGFTTERAFGGCAIANAIHAACHGVDTTKYHLYSMLGNFLGPTLTDRKLVLNVYPIRHTRTFITKRVELKQKLDDGTERSVMMVLADFHVAEPAKLTYSRPPSCNYSEPGDCPTNDEQSARLRKAGLVTDESVATRKAAFSLMSQHFEERPCPESIWPQNLAGVVKDIKTSQDHLPITSKTSAIWYKARDPSTLSLRADHFAALGFIMDHALSFIPLTHDHSFLEDSAACSSLDFALRFFSPGDQLDMSQWHLREMKAIQASQGRTYSEAQIWDERGALIASMTQQSILRPAKDQTGVKL